MKNLYKLSRERFLDSCSMISGHKELLRFEFPYIDADRETMTTEYLRIGDRNLKKWLMISSGTIGLDLFIGSEIQTNFLKNLAFKSISLPKDVGLLLIHGVNPWGAAWLRPGNVNNVVLDFNCSTNFELLKKAEEKDEKLLKLQKTYKFCEKSINPIGFKFETTLLTKILFYYIRFGPPRFYEALKVYQRHNLVGLNYGGKDLQRELKALEKNVHSMLPESFSELVHIDIQTGTSWRQKHYIKAEDPGSLAWFKSLNSLPAALQAPFEEPVSVISGLKDSWGMNNSFIAGTYMISASGAHRRYMAQRDENIFHNTKIWIENWSRDEQSFWPTDSYTESKHKRRLLKHYYPKSPSWHLISIQNSEKLLASILNKLANTNN